MSDTMRGPLLIADGSAGEPPLVVTVPYAVLTDRRLSRAARLMYLAFCAEIGDGGRRAVPVRRLAERAGGSDRAVRMWNAELAQTLHLRRHRGPGYANVLELVSGGGASPGRAPDTGAVA